MAERTCKDCPAGTKRKAPHPGPRCATHDREVKKARKQERHEHRVQLTYGLGKGEYAILYAAQDGLCAICRRATGRTRRLCVDHDHRTGLVRGLCCRPCNDLLGHLRDDPELFLRAAQYLKDPPAGRILGERVFRDPRVQERR